MGLAEPSSIEEALRSQDRSLAGFYFLFLFFIFEDKYSHTDRSLAGPPLPAKYLTLEHVEYHENHPLDQRQDAGSLAQSVRAWKTDATPETKRGREGGREGETRGGRDSEGEGGEERRLSSGSQEGGRDSEGVGGRERRL
jgi:hypothetical protein